MASRPDDRRREVVGHFAAGRMHVGDGDFVQKAEAASLRDTGWVVGNPVAVARSSQRMCTCVAGRPAQWGQNVPVAVVEEDTAVASAAESTAGLGDSLVDGATVTLLAAAVGAVVDMAMDLSPAVV